MMTVNEAREIILSQARDFGAEEVSIYDAYGRILSEDIVADRDYPPFNRAAVDGFAVRTRDLGIYYQFKVIEEVVAGKTAKRKITSGTCIRIMTGAPVPEEADAVIKVEDALIEQGKVTFNERNILPWTNIAKQGEDASRGTTLLKKGEICHPTNIAALAAIGKYFIKVYKTPSVLIISTGNEVKKVRTKNIATHHIRDSNSHSLENFLKGYRIDKIRKYLVKDEPDQLKNIFKSINGHDIVIVSGGVSMGIADHVPDTLVASGFTKLFHKVQIKPGKPLWFGKKENGTVVFALPGNPMSCQVAFKVFIEPYLRKCFSMNPQRSIFLPIGDARMRKTKFEEYFPCALQNCDGRTILSPRPVNGSGDLTSTLLSDGIAVHPQNKETLESGDFAEFIFWD